MNELTETMFTGSSDITKHASATEKTENGEAFRNTRFKILKSVCLIVTWICMGLYNGVTGPTLPDLGERLNTEYDSLGFAIAFRSIGKMIGSPTYGYLRDRFSSKGDLLLGVALSLVALTVVTKPWVTTVGLLAFLFFAEGFQHGGINAVGNSMLVLMWKEKAGMPVHFLHFGYGVGAFLSPLIAREFLSQHVTANVSSASTNWSQESGSNWNNQTMYDANTNLKITVKESQVEIPYAIVASFVFVVGLVYLSLFLYKPIRNLTTKFGSVSYTAPCRAPFLEDRPKSAIGILALFFLYYMVTSAIDKSLTSFLFTYAVESDIGFTKSEAAYLNTAFFACYGGGRLIMGLVALRFQVKYIIFFEIFVMTGCSAVITFFAFQSRLFLWIFSCLLALFFGPIYPSGMAFVDRYLPLYGLVVAIFDIGNGIGAFSANWFSGYLISRIGPRSLLYFTFSAAVVVCINIVVAQIVGSGRGDRHKANKTQLTLVVQDTPDI